MDFCFRKNLASKLILSLLSVLLFLSTLVPGISLAEENQTAQEDKKKLITLNEDVSLEVGNVQYKLLKDQPLYISINENSEALLQVEDTEVTLPQIDYTELEHLETPHVIYERELAVGQITSDNELTLYSDEKLTTRFGSLLTTEAIDIFEETELAYKLIIGNRHVFVSKEEVHVENQEEAEPSTSVEEPNEVKKQEEAEISIKNADEPVTENSTHFQIKGTSLSVYDNSSGKLVKVGALTDKQVFPVVELMGNWIKVEFGDGYGYVWKDSTISRNTYEVTRNLDDGTLKTIYHVKSEKYLSVYDNSTGELVQFGSVDPEVVYPVVQETGNWYKVRLAGKLGYIYKPATTKVFNSSDTHFKVATDFLSVYDNSTGELVRVGSLEKGQVFPRVGDLGNWHKIRYGNGYGYVWKDSTEPATASGIKNLNKGTKNSTRKIVSSQYLSVYDNTSGSLVRYAQILPNVEYPIIERVGNWYKVDVAGRIGYVYKPASREVFHTTDRYFEVYDENVPVYDNRSGSLVQVATLKKGQVFPRVSDAGNWHKIKFNNYYGYVWKGSTTVGDASKVGNPSPANTVPKNQTFVTKEPVSVYDNSSGKLVEFAQLSKGVSYNILDRVGDWVKIELSGRIGYIYQTGVQFGPVITHTRYDLSLQQMVDIQMKVSPQTDKYRYEKAYVDATHVAVDPNDPTVGVVTAEILEVKENTSNISWTYGRLPMGATVTIVTQLGDWYEIKYGTWRNAKPGDVSYYVNPNNFPAGSKAYFQFLELSKSANATAYELNSKILSDKGILKDKGEAFITAGRKFHVNEVYLISHALLETGNGQSTLSNGMLVEEVDGQKVEPKVVYNMYGIQARDSCPDRCGSEYAYKQGWFTPEAAIIGGAEFISKRYVNNETYKQNTLYKMRWNPAKPGTHQYATDIGWSFKQVSNIEKLYNSLDSYTLYYDVPIYK